MLQNIINMLLDFLDIVFNAFKDGIRFSEDRKHQFNARFGNPTELAMRNHKGWCIDGKRFLDLETSRRNICIVAGSGKGKTQVHVFPTIINTECSMVINDNSGELTKTIPYLKSKGINTMVLNLDSDKGIYLNPLDGCKGDISAIRKIAKTLMSSASDKNDFFSLSAEDCITLFIQYVLESEPRVHANLGNVYRLILEYQGNPKVIEQLMASKASESVWIKFKALAGNSEKTLQSITATALSALSWVGDNPTLASITSITNISFDAFRKTPHVLFIQYPVSDAKFYAQMVALIFQSFYRFGFSVLPKQDDLDIMMVLDEFSSLIQGLPDYSNIISNSRKFKIPQMIILQDESLLSPYRELKDNILQNCFVKIYYGGQDKKAFELEKLLGSYEYIDRETEQPKIRALMTANEIREMNNEVLILPNGMKPLKITVTPAFKQSRLKNILSMKSDESKQIEQSLFYDIQYINLDPYKDKVNASILDDIPDEVA